MRNLLSAAILLLSATAINAHNTRITFFSPEIVRVTKTANAADTFPTSKVVIASPDDVQVKQSTSGKTTTYKTSRLTVNVDADGNVTFKNNKGKTLLKENSYTLTPITDGVDKGAYKVSQGFKLDPQEPIYGLGMLQNGKLSQRGEHRTMQQSNLEDYAHFFQSIKGYGIYWDNYSPTDINDNGEVVELTSQVGPAADYYFMYGGDADGVISLMRKITGKAPMLPLWTYGFHQSRERYKSQHELLEVLNRYRADSIPLDGMIQDWQYWGSNYTWNAMEFINPDFDHAQAMIDSVHASNAHISISVWASFGPQTKQYRELADKNLLFSFETWPQSGLGDWPPRMDYPSGVRVYDCYSPEARDIYWNYLSKMYDMGIDGWWLDSTDPDHHSYKDSDLDELCSAGSFRSVRNLFPFMTVGGVDSHQRAYDSNKRVFILTRSYFAGQQRYGANSWSGDIASSWESLRNQIPLCLNHTLTANPYVNTDIGGFFAGQYSAPGKPGYLNPKFRELYVRWMQFGAFCPMMRSHGTDFPRELHYYGKKGEPVYDALADAIRLRYSLLPYIYSTSRMVSRDDDSFMRAMFMDFKDDKNTWNNGKQFMFGRSILVCPVLDPLYTAELSVKTDEMSGWNKNTATTDATSGQIDWNATHQYDVYLPAGTKWFDYWTDELLNGGKTISTTVPLNRCPLYVKAGSIIPVGPEIQYTSQPDRFDLTLKIYPGADASFTLYDDEGDNYNYLNGKYSEIPLQWDDSKGTLTIGDRKGEYDGMPVERKFTVTLPGHEPQTVSYNGGSITVNMR